MCIRDRYRIRQSQYQCSGDKQYSDIGRRLPHRFIIHHMIIAQNLIKSFGDQRVIKDISITFHKGKTNLVIGRSGSGKTVLLKMLVGLMKPDSGKILYDGEDFTELDKKELLALRMKVGMLFQGSALFDSMTVEENIRFPMDMFTHSTRLEKQKRVDYCLDRVGLAGNNKKYPSEVSGGMQKRVGIALSLIHI